MPLPIIPAIVIQSPPISYTVHLPDYEAMDNASLYNYGNKLLKSGRFLTRVIAALSVAAKRDPQNVDYRLALGCAYMSRYASVSYGWQQKAQYETDFQSYMAFHKLWDQAQNDSTSALFGKKEPVEPGKDTVTPDDNKPFILSRADTEKELQHLSDQSAASFQAARDMARTTSDEQIASVEYTYAWSLMTELRYGKGVATKLPKREDIAAVFQGCTSKAAANADYWQSLAAAYVSDYFDIGDNGGFLKILQGGKIYDKEATDKSFAALQHAIALKPQRFDTLFQASLLLANDSPEAALPLLEKATQLRGTNTLLWYFLAVQRFRVAETMKKKEDAKLLKQKAIEAVQSGNQSPEYATLSLAPPLPVYLKAAWNYKDSSAGLGEDARIISLLAGLSVDFITDQEQNDELEQAIKNDAVLFDMGLKTVGNSNVNQLENQRTQMQNITKSRALMGIATCYRAWGIVKKSNQKKQSDVKQSFLDIRMHTMEFLSSIDKQLTQ